jgi:hypothetical protein
VLVDTSVWVHHLRRHHAGLATQLQRGEVWTHPFVIGELACGTLKKRREILSALAALPQVAVAEHHEVLAFIESHRFMGLGIGLIDVHLLASARLAGMRLWTLDRALALAAQKLGLRADRQA